MIWVLFIGFTIISWLVSKQLQSRFRKYSRIPVDNGLTGREIVEQMLQDHGISGVKVGSVRGKLSDHYNPLTKTINLSRDVYSGRSIAAAAVAAHECGHAVQHAEAYSWLQLRSKLVPAVSFSSKWVHWLLLGGILTMERFPQLLLAGIILFAFTTLFSLITLPVEVDASRRALAWIKGTRVANYEKYDKAKDALKWAAYTYFIAALASLATLLYYVLLFIGAGDD